jgi:hypothetical protein
VASTEEVWEARRAASKAILKGFASEHTEASQGAKVKTIYMDACPARDDVHPAIAIVEGAHLAGCKQDALFHQGQAQKYIKAIEAIEALTYKEEK